MAGVDVGSAGGKKRATNSEINMIPFIDLLMCTIAFLLITAVWVTSSRVELDAQVPGQRPCNADDCGTITDRTMHVTVAENDFVLAWKQGSTVLSEVHVPRNAVLVGDGDKVSRYPELGQAIEKQWGQFHEHFDPSDHRQDQAVLHTDDRTPFRDLVAVLDAVNGTRRDLRSPAGHVSNVPAFNTTFAVR
jgi:biopolymer transport protein ExbD